MRAIRPRLASLSTAAMLRVAALWAWVRAQVMGNDDANFAPDPLVWKVLVGAIVSAAAIVIACGASRWGAP